MIKGTRRKSLTPQTILEKISEYDIFRLYMRDKTWKVNKATCSPFRKEENPSFLISNRGDGLAFIDFGDPDKRGDCFTFVKVMFNIHSMNDVLIKLDQDFGLGISGNVNVGDYKKITAEYKQPEEAGKRYSLIQVVTRKFTKEDLEYWKGYHQDIDDLRREKIYSIKELFLNKKRHALPLNSIRFGYLHEDGYWKIYRPFANKRNKWLSNVPITTACGLSNLSSSHNSLICDSKKDYMVCKKIYPYTCHVQNESLAAFSVDTINYIKQNSKDVYFGGDADAAGKKASWAITEAFGFKHINPPDRLLPDNKDWADWAKVENLDNVKEHFINKGLL